MTKKLLTLTFVGLSTIANGMFYTGEKAFNDVCQKVQAEAAASKVSFTDKVKASVTQGFETAKANFGSVKAAPQVAFKAVDGAVKNDPRVFGALYAGGLATVAVGIGVAGKLATKETEASAPVKVPTNMDKVKEMGQKALDYGKDHKGALAAVAVAVPVAAVASKVAVKKYKASQKPTIEQLAKDAKNLKEFAYSLNVHGYTRVDLEKANVEMPRGGKVYVMSQLA